MLISELYENNDYQEKLNREIMNVIMMYMKTGVVEIDIENIISELDKNDVVATEQDIKDFVETNDNLSINQEQQVVFSTEGTDIEDERPDVSGEEEYNPASEKAKEATKKRMK